VSALAVSINANDKYEVQAPSAWGPEYVNMAGLHG
jgi:hypothetical protein